MGVVGRGVRGLLSRAATDPFSRRKEKPPTPRESAKHPRRDFRTVERPTRKQLSKRHEALCKRPIRAQAGSYQMAPEPSHPSFAVEAVLYGLQIIEQALYCSRSVRIVC